MKVLIAGGAGYIGSTIASACLDAGISPVVLDSLVTGRREFATGREFYEGDIADGSWCRLDILADHVHHGADGVGRSSPISAAMAWLLAFSVAASRFSAALRATESFVPLHAQRSRRSQPCVRRGYL